MRVKIYTLCHDTPTEDVVYVFPTCQKMWDKVDDLMREWANEHMELWADDEDADPNALSYNALSSIYNKYAEEIITTDMDEIELDELIEESKKGD